MSNPATWFAGGDLLVHATPLDWLKADRVGVVILDERRAASVLRNVRSVTCGSDEVAASIHAHAQPSLKIFVSDQKGIAA